MHDHDLGTVAAIVDLGSRQAMLDWKTAIGVKELLRPRGTDGIACAYSVSRVLATLIGVTIFGYYPWLMELKST